MNSDDKICALVVFAFLVFFVSGIWSIFLYNNNNEERIHEELLKGKTAIEVRCAHGSYSDVCQKYFMDQKQ